MIFAGLDTRLLQAVEWHDVAPLATMLVVSAQPEISQRDLRMRSKEIMDAVERGQTFTVTRDGHEIGELVPLRRRRRFVSRAEFAETSRTAPDIDLAAFRADQEAVHDEGTVDRYAR
jgi:prevent-host-death family protein